MKNVLSLKFAAVALLGAISGTAGIQAATPVEECSKELIRAFYPEPFVRETLKKFNVPQDKWDAIVKGLNDKEKDVVKTVEEKASKMDPNPLKDPNRRKETVKIFRETLLQIFSDVLKANGVTDDQQIQAMLDDVQQQKTKRFAECLQKRASDAEKADTPSDNAPKADNSKKDTDSENNDNKE